MNDAIGDLLPGEQIMWEGRPTRHHLLRPADALLIPFSLLWCGFAVFWEASVLAARASTDHGPPVFFALWGVPFVILGLYFVVGRFVVRAIASRRTRYTITDRRVLVIGGLSGSRTTSAYLSSLPPPVMAVGRDGSGSLAFGNFPGIAEAFSSRNGWRAWASEPSAYPVLWHVPNVRHVRDLVATLQTDSIRTSRR